MDLAFILSSPSFYILCTFAVIYFLGRWPLRYLKSYGIPGPEPTAFLGNLSEIRKKGNHQTDIAWLKTYGNVVGYYIGLQPAILVADPEMLEQIMVKQFSNFTNRYEVISPVKFQKLSVLRATDETWKTLRYILSPNFSAKKLKEMGPLVHKAISNLENNCNSYAATEEAVNINNLFGCFTMDAIATTAFGVEVDSQKNPNDIFTTNARSTFKVGNRRARFPLALICKPLYTLLINLRIHQFFQNNFFEKFSWTLLEGRKKEAASHLRKDLLQMMLNTQQNDKIQDSNTCEVKGESGNLKLNKRKLTDSEIVAQCIVFFLAGYESTATTLSFMLYALALHQDIQEKLYQEIQSVLGEEPANYDNAQKITYLEQCISETLRKYPIATKVSREASKETVIKNWRIPTKTNITIPIYAIHHNPAYWPEPEKFDPERFTPEAQKKHIPYTYLPFGAGPRICIGMRLAQMEMKMAVIDIIRKFKFVPCSKTEDPVIFRKGQLLSPENGIWLKIVKR